MILHHPLSGETRQRRQRVDACGRTARLDAAQGEAGETGPGGGLCKEAKACSGAEEALHRPGPEDHPTQQVWKEQALFKQVWEK